MFFFFICGTSKSGFNTSFGADWTSSVGLFICSTEPQEQNNNATKNMKPFFIKLEFQFASTMSP
jgi:hypothetical protein